MTVTAMSQRVFTEIDRRGVLLLHDRRFPSVTACIVGQPVAGSWWSHPQAHLIFAAVTALEDRVASVKLIAGKVTLVAPRLWAQLVAVGTAREPWQLKDLSPAAVDLLGAVDRADDPHLVGRTERPAGSELERRLLVYGESVHTDAGHHVKGLVSWPVWAAAHGVAGPPPSSSSARRALGDAVAAATEPTGRRLVPWPV